MTSPPPPSTLSLHDALPIWSWDRQSRPELSRYCAEIVGPRLRCRDRISRDRKSTRLNSSHITTSYAVFCLKKKNSYTRIEHFNYCSSARPAESTAKHQHTHY